MENGSELRIMTHNIWVPPLYNRRALLGEIYNKYDPDILCLQEITPVIYKEGFLNDFTGKYTVVMPHDDGFYNNTPVLFRSEMFSLIDSGWHLFDGKNNNASKSVTWAVLEHAKGGAGIGICSAHFWYDIKSYDDDLCRKYDAEQTMIYIRRIIDKYNVPVILMGDLNCNITSPAYRFLIEQGGMDARMAAEEYNDRINTIHAYPVLDEEKKLYSQAPMPVGTHMEAIDHMILFSHEKVRVRSLHVVSDKTALTASDHCPVYMDAELLQAEGRIKSTVI